VLAPLDHHRRSRAKFSYATRNIRPEALAGLVDDRAPEAGDVVLARVTALGQHKRIEGPDGRRGTLFAGDEIVVCYGDRYAPDQYEAVVPDNLGPCHLAAAGGIAATVRSAHAAMGSPTAIEPIGICTTADGEVVNLRSWRLPEPPAPEDRPFTVAVLGTSMNAGKTTTAAGLARGLTGTGRRVGAAKVTGTGAGGDKWLLADAGADPVLDFTSAGLASTYRCTPEQVEDALRTLHGHLAERAVDVAVLEVADGLLQAETAALVRSAVFRTTVDAIVFAAGDAMGAIAGVAALRALDLPVVAVSGVLTCSPLAMAEAAAAVDLPVLGLDDLWRGAHDVRPALDRVAAAVGGG
jgi:molybdopterin-guanine dinucleotide biosynthesis protein